MARRKQRRPKAAAIAKAEPVDTPAATGDEPESPSSTPNAPEPNVPKPNGAEPNGATCPAPGAIPPSTLRSVISVAIVFHLFALFVSYSAIIEPSQTHSQCLDSLSFYLRSTHFSADGRPYYLAHVTPDERPHRLQIAKRPKNGVLLLDTQTEWTTVEPDGNPGLTASDRYGRWMKLVATLSQSDQPSLAAALLMPVIESDPSIAAVRVVRLPTELTTVEEDSEGPVYLARVVRDTDRVQLVAIEPARLTTQRRDPKPEFTPERGGQSAP